jgi:uncharacterized membrane protein YkoI
MNKKFNKYVIPAITATLIAGGASTAAFAAANQDKQVEKQAQTEQQENAALAKQVKITEDESKDIALKEVPGTVNAVDLDDENGTTVYEVEVLAKDGTQHDVIIDATTGKVLDVEIDEENDSQKQAALAKQAKITEAQSKDIALKEVPGTVNEVELDDENGTIVYDVEVIAKDGTRHDVIIDAKTGKVINVEIEDEDENGNEENDDEENDPQEQAALAKQAKITEAQSKDIALKEVPGTVNDVELEDEDGTIVYGVEVIAKDGTQHDVKIDAKTGKVVKVELDDEDENGKEENDDEE